MPRVRPRLKHTFILRLGSILQDLPWTRDCFLATAHLRTFWELKSEKPFDLH